MLELSVGMDVSGLYIEGDEDFTFILEVLPNLEADNEERITYPFAVKMERLNRYGYKSIVFRSYTKNGVFNECFPKYQNIKRREKPVETSSSVFDTIANATKPVSDTELYGKKECLDDSLHN